VYVEVLAIRAEAIAVGGNAADAMKPEVSSAPQLPPLGLVSLEPSQVFDRTVEYLWCERVSSFVGSVL
jgi:hypothetical protein